MKLRKDEAKKGWSEERMKRRKNEAKKEWSEERMKRRKNEAKKEWSEGMKRRDEAGGKEKGKREGKAMKRTNENETYSTFKARILVGYELSSGTNILATSVFTSVTIFGTILRARVLIKGKRVKTEVTRIWFWSFDLPRFLIISSLPICRNKDKLASSCKGTSPV
jgi:hypothetical protein